MMTEMESERMAFEKMNAESLERFVDKTIADMAASANLEPGEALDILKHIQVQKVGDLKGAIEALWNDMEAVKRADPLKLSEEIERAIEAISMAADLDTEEITTIFSSMPSASLADVSYRLHAQSAHDRARF